MSIKKKVCPGIENHECENQIPEDHKICGDCHEMLCDAEFDDGGGYEVDCAHTDWVNSKQEMYELHRRQW